MKKIIWIFLIPCAALLLNWFFFKTRKVDDNKSTPLLVSLTHTTQSSPLKPTEASKQNKGSATASPSVNKPLVPSQLPIHVPDFVRAEEMCPRGVKCVVSGEPWAEYLTMKQVGRENVEGLAILNFLMRNLDNPEYQKVAKKIILEEFQKDSQMQYWYYGDYLHTTGNDIEAKQTYDEFIKKFSSNEDEIPWSNLGSFYEDIKEYPTALHCYEKELELAGRRKDVRESYTKEFYDSLEASIKRVKAQMRN